MSSHRRGPWSLSEDNCLKQQVRTHGILNWVRIAETLGSRTSKQCRERYYNHLHPNLNHGPITKEEGAQIEQLVQQIGRRWVEIARSLPGRSDNTVKNWWNSKHKRRKQLGCCQVGSSCHADDSRHGGVTMGPRAAAVQSPVEHRYEMPRFETASPSPCSSESSVIGTSLNTAGTPALPRPTAKLPSLRTGLGSNGSDGPLPGPRLFGQPTDPSKADAQQLLPPSHLHTAPNSLLQQREGGSISTRDSRMNLSSLLG